MPKSEDIQRWWTGRLLDADIAAALEAPRRSVQVLSSTPTFQGEIVSGGRGNWRTRRIPGKVRVGFAAAYALHVYARLPLEIAALVVESAWDECARVARVIDFVHDDDELVPGHVEPLPTSIEAMGEERDPMWWWTLPDFEEMGLAPRHFGDPSAHTYPALDEYLEIVDGRMVYWTRPERDPVERLSELVVPADFDFEDREAQAAMGALAQEITMGRGDFPRTSILVGMLEGDGYRLRDLAMQEGMSEVMRKLFPETHRDNKLHDVENYRSKISINVTLAARLMKRRALGFLVIDQFDAEQRFDYANSSNSPVRKFFPGADPKPDSEG